jgi:hypothetical protein
MTTLTIKQAKKLGQDLVSGTAVKAKVTTTVQTLYTAHCGGDVKADKSLDSKSLILPETLLVALWEQCVTDKPTLAVIRSIFNRVTKAVHKELDIDKPALCVKNGQLVEVQKRGRKGGGAEGGEGGEGKHTINAEGNAVPTREQNRELMSNLKILAELHDKSKDVAIRSALKFAIANLV